jgi:hypothetical protein
VAALIIAAARSISSAAGAGTRIGAARIGPFADLDELILHILGNIDQHRPGTPRSGDAESLRNDAQQFVGRTDQEVVFGDRNAQAIGIDFLKGIGTDHRPGHLPGDRHQRNRIQLGVGNRRQQIGRAGAGRRHADRRHAGGARHPLGHETAALLVPGEDMMDQHDFDRAS